MPAITPAPTHLPNAISADELDASLFHFYDENPVLQQSNNCKWDCLYIDPGTMLYHDGMFHMFFNGVYGILFWSASAMRPQQTASTGRASVNPILSNQDHTQWSQAFLATLLYVDGMYFLYFDFVTPAARGTNVYLATLHWLTNVNLQADLI